MADKTSGKNSNGKSLPGPSTESPEQETKNKETRIPNANSCESSESESEKVSQGEAEIQAPKEVVKKSTEFLNAVMAGKTTKEDAQGKSLCDPNTVPPKQQTNNKESGMPNSNSGESSESKPEIMKNETPGEVVNKTGEMQINMNTSFQTFMSAGTSGKDLKNINFLGSTSLPLLTPRKSMEPGVPNFNFGKSIKNKPVFFKGEAPLTVLMKKVEELATKIDEIDNKLNNMNSLLSSVLNLVTNCGQKNVDTISCKSTKDSPTLSIKLWEKIFQHLKTYDLLQVRLTCQSWKELVDNSSTLRECFSISFPEGTIIDRDYLPANLPPAAEVALRDARIISVSGLWPSLGSTLVHLTLSNCKMRQTMLVDILRQTPNLKVLRLEKMEWILYADDFYFKPNLQLNHLEVLILDKSYGVRLLDFPRLQVLKYLMLGRTIPIFFDPVNSLVSRIQNTLQNIEIYYGSKIVNSLTTLTNLKLKKLEFYKHPQASTGGIISKVIELCHVQPTIEELLLPKEVDDITEDHLKKIGSYLPRLKSLRATTVQEQTLNAFLNALPCLKILDWNTASNVSLICCSNPKLHEIHLRYLKLRGDNLRIYLKKSPNIRTISYEHCYFEDWRQVFDSINHCKNLRHLKLVGLHVAKSDESLLEYFDELRTLKMSELTMPKAMLKILFHLCPQLEELELRRMAHVDNEVVELACRKMRKLKRLTLDGCPLTDVPAIEQYRSQLEHLHIENCGKNDGHHVSGFTFGNPVSL